MTWPLQTKQSFFPRIDCTSAADVGATRITGIGVPYSQALPQPYFEANVVGGAVYPWALDYVILPLKTFFGTGVFARVADWNRCGWGSAR